MNKKAINQKKSQESIEDQMINNDKRLDGRKCESFRQSFMKIGVNTQAHGSSYIEIGNTKIICSVYGPRQKKRSEKGVSGKLNVDFRYTKFAQKWTNRRSKNYKNEDERENGILVEKCLLSVIKMENYHKSQVDVFVLVLEDDGDALSMSINAAILALNDAGIEMIDLVSACSVCKIEDSLIIDPVAIEEQKKQAIVTIALMPSRTKIAQLIQQGELPFDEAIQSINLCMNGCEKISQLMSKVLLSTAKKRLK